MTMKDKFGGLHSPLRGSEASRLNDIFSEWAGMDAGPGDPEEGNYSSIYGMPLPYVLKVINWSIKYLGGEYQQDIRSDCQAIERDPKSTESEKKEFWDSYIDELRSSKDALVFLAEMKKKVERAIRSSR